MKALHVFYDATCDLCAACRSWLEAQPQHVRLHFTPYQSELARALCPGLEKFRPEKEIVVLSDDGALYQGARAWVMVLWATESGRALSLKLAEPKWLPRAAKVVSWVSRHRGGLSRLFPRSTDDMARRALRETPQCRSGGCAL